MMTTDAPVGVPRSFPLSKTKAVSVLARNFRHPGFQNVSTPDDRAKGHERWSVYVIADYGRRRHMVEVCGPPAVLPKAAVVAAYRAIGLEVEFGSDPKGNRSIRFKPMKPPAPPPEVLAALEAAQALADKAQREIDAQKPAQVAPAPTDGEIAEARIAGAGLDNGGKP